MTATALAEGAQLCAAPDFPYLDDDIITLVKTADDHFEMSAPGAFGLPVTCTYWKEPNARAGDDAWRYKLTPNARITHSGPFSHVSARGCQIAIWQHFIDINLICFPQDNSHLDACDAEIAARTEKAWLARSKFAPRTGDFVQMPDGKIKRFCKVTDRYAQTTTALRKSYYIGVFGDVSYSGGLEPGIDLTNLEISQDNRLGEFWFFHHGRGGAGRGICINLMCRTWRMRVTASQQQ